MSGSDYVPPVEAIMAALETVGLDAVLAQECYSHVDPDDLPAVLTEFGRYCSEVVVPADRVADRDGTVLDHHTGTVRTPDAVQRAYRLFVEGGWGSLTAPAEFGGGGLPAVVGTALDELMTSASIALSLNPTLTRAGIELMTHWSGAELQQRYLHQLVSGEWTGTMNLTEPGAGSDLSGILTRATRRDDATWGVSGTKIFITWGEHDLTDNIVHLVLARSSETRPGTQGLSLFLVPKFVVTDSGALGERNRVRCVATEHKLGIHGSPTCVMEYDDATGYLVGDENGGLAAMFTMMNAARLAIGVEGLGVSERAYQQAAAFAGERRQGRAPGAARDEVSPIADHPDVRRMLLTMSSSITAQRLLLYTVAAERDRARADDDRAAGARARVDILTPIAKSWCTDEGVRNASLAIQIHGGMGYIEETGVAQRLRDARIAPIYEGTNGIQAIDLVNRKVVRDDGHAMHDILEDAQATLRELKDDRDLATLVAALTDAVDALAGATQWLLVAEAADALAGATAYLDLAALVVGGWLLASHAARLRATGSRDAARVVAQSEFFATERLPDCRALQARATAGADRLAVL